MDPLVIVFTVLAAIGYGTFPVFLKSPRVLEAKVHPFVFQLYKSVWAFIIGAVCVIVKRQFAFTPWAIGAAVCWVPGGVLSIIAVPIIGMGSFMVTAAASYTISALLIFWLAFDEHFAVHELGSTKLVLVPFYLVGILVGLMGLGWAARPPDEPSQQLGEGVEEEEGEPQRHLLHQKQLGMNPKSWSASSLGRIFLGFFCATVVGCLQSGQGALVEAGRIQNGLSPGEQDARFSPLGSWLFVFGLVSTLLTMLLWAIAAIVALLRKEAVPAGKFQQLWLPGSCTGITWSLGYVSSVLTVSLGATGIVQAQLAALTTIISGAWALFYYREIRGCRAVAWVAAAAFTTMLCGLLGLESAR